ncbi:hypothetical protein [Vibrio sp. 11986-1-5]|uniref:hypothetical protein n=1 Tax=Vibrio sp. 11986-1-5 TaxID=2211215 RepID=UPI000D73998A|nr:hypothetical protein [Vibrio sp. 11986-1-5]PXA66152.1 hypothetical protein DMC15_16550 [Vibrio sp. 11986-1-5]
MEQEQENSFIAKFDSDDKLISKGKMLAAISMILIALEVTGATIKEANTFLFKIDFANQNGVTFLLLGAIIYLAVRYLNYAQPYHHQLFLIWSRRMMLDRELFHFNPHDDCISGFLSDAIGVYGGDEPGIREARYVKSGLFRRSIVYPTKHQGEDGEVEFYDVHINLCSFNEKWTSKMYLKLLAIEFKYRVLAFVKHREHLDLLGPYIFAIVSVISVLVPWGNFT